MLTKYKCKAKKTLSVIILIFLYLLLAIWGTGCVEKELINDPATGSIFPAQNLKPLLDGRYSATTRYYDSRGYAQKLDIIIKNSIITQVDFKEISKNSLDRITLEGSEKSWADLGTLNLSSLYLKLYSELLLSQVPNEIETISGATQTSDRFIELSEAAIEQAKKGDHETIKIDTFDTYTVTGQTDPEGFQGTLKASFDGSTLTNINYDEIRVEDGKSKRKSTDLAIGTSFTTLFDTLLRDALANQTLDSPFPENELSPEKSKYAECLRLLRELRTPF